MTYYEKYSVLKSEEELELAVKEDAKVALFLGGNPDRIKAIEDAGNKVANEKGWMEVEE